MRVTYQAPRWTPERVTGRFVLYHGARRGFTVYEAASDHRERPGMGPTIREYQTAGDDLPPDVADRARQERTTIKWD